MAGPRSAETSWVALDKSEGVVKRQISRAVVFTACVPEWWRTEASETLTVNQFSAARPELRSFRQPSIRRELQP